MYIILMTYRKIFMMTSYATNMKTNMILISLHIDIKFMIKYVINNKVNINNEELKKISLK